MSDPTDIVVARIDERTRHTDETIAQLIVNYNLLAQRITPLEAWKANVDAGRDNLSEKLSDLSEIVTQWKDQQKKRDDDAAARAQRQSEVVSRFVTSGLTLLFGLMVPAITGLISQIPSLHDVRGQIEIVAALAVATLIGLAILQMRSRKP